MFLSKLSQNQKIKLFTFLGIILILSLHVPFFLGKIHTKNSQESISRITLVATSTNKISSSPKNSINPANDSGINNSNEKNSMKNPESNDSVSSSSGANSQVNNDSSVIQDIIKLIEENKIYPKNARLRNMEGDVKVAFCISEEGYLAGDVTVVESTAPAILQKAAVESVSRAFRKPFKKLSQTLDLQITIRYSLIR